MNNNKINSSNGLVWWIKWDNEIDIWYLNNKNKLLNILTQNGNLLFWNLQEIINNSSSLIEWWIFNNLKTIPRIKKIIIIWSSASWKSTMINYLKKHIWDNTFIPKRYITREKRMNESEDENLFITKQNLDDLYKKWEIDFKWNRIMEKNWENCRDEMYWFEKTSDWKLKIYWCNNAIYNNNQSIEPNDIMKDSLVIWIYAPDEIRWLRLQKRSPDLIKHKPSEVQTRLLDSSNNIKPNCHLILNNYLQYEQESKNDILLLIEYLSQLHNSEYEVYRSKMLRIMKKPVLINWKEKIFEYVDRAPGVRILVTNWDHILLTKEKRWEINWFDYRLPWWKVFDKVWDYVDSLNEWNIDKHIKDTAKKELKEETSIDIWNNDMELLSVSKAWATVNWDLHYFKVEHSPGNISKKILTDEWEDIEPWFFHKNEILEMCLNWLIQEDRSVAVLLKYILNSK